MALYVFSAQASAATTTAAAAGIGKVEQGATLCSPKIYTIEIGPNANSADSTYGGRVKRQTTNGTWVVGTGALLDSTHQAACLATPATSSSTAGSASTVLFLFGWHMRAGYRWVSIPGGEIAVAVAASNGVIIEYANQAQGTDVNSVAMWWNE